MKPDIFMPFYAPRFWQAVEGLPDHVVCKYLRAITHYWFHNGCKGLRNDDEYLRSVHRCEREEWVQVKATLFDSGEFWKKENGLWHQGFAREVYLDAQNLMKRNQLKTANAREALAARRVEKNVQ